MIVTMIRTRLANYSHIFQKDLNQNPDSVYCTEVEGKQKLNQEYLKGFDVSSFLILFDIQFTGSLSFLQITSTTGIFIPLKIGLLISPLETKRWKIMK